MIKEIVSKPLSEIMDGPGVKWDLTLSIKEVPDGENRTRLWVVGLRADKAIDRGRAEKSLEIALEMLRNEKWRQNLPITLVGSTP